MDNNSSYFNQSTYQQVPNGEVNWAALAQQWIRQNQPNQDQTNPNWTVRPQIPQNYYGQQMYNPTANDRYRLQTPYRAPPRPLQFFSGPADGTRIQRPRPPGLFNGPPGWEVRPPPPQIQRPPAPLFPSGTRAAAPPGTGQPWSMPGYEWPQEPPPPPPPAWIGSDVANQEQPVIDTAERKKLPKWIRDGLERMEAEKKKREEQEEKRKLREKLEKEWEEQIKEGKSKFDSDSEEEPPKRKFEEYPEVPPLTAAEKEDIKSTNTIIRKCCEETLANFKAKQSAKVVVNKATAALTALASLGGSSSEEEDDREVASLPKKESGDKVESKFKEKSGERRSRKSSRSRSPVRRHSYSDHRKSSKSDHDDDRSYRRLRSGSDSRKSHSNRY